MNTIRTKTQERLDKMLLEIGKDFKIIDGQKIYDCVCTICGKNFTNKDFYRKTCDDKIRHDEIRRHRAAQRDWSRVGNGGWRDSNSGECSGSWDNAVDAYEQNND